MTTPITSDGISSKSLNLLERCFLIYKTGIIILNFKEKFGGI